MKTCFNCGNSTDPATVAGRRDLARPGAPEHHPLRHFAYCKVRCQWLEAARRDCRNWSSPLRHDAGRALVSAPVAAEAATRFYAKNKYRLMAVAYIAFMGAALTAVGLGVH